MGGSAKLADLTKRVEALEKALAKLDLHLHDLRVQAQKTETDIKNLGIILQDHEKRISQTEQHMKLSSKILAGHQLIIRRLQTRSEAREPQQRRWNCKYLIDDDDY